MLKKQFPDTAVHAYTATASEKVRQEIIEQLKLVNPKVLVGSFDRPNLIYSVQRRSSGLGQLRAVLERHPRQSGIVYCISRAEVDRTSQALCQLGYRAAPYHAGMTEDQRHGNQEAFREDRLDTIVATVAFGMGIDKPDVRYVVHAGMPKTLEHFQQESGRAGRDGLPAECWLLHSGADYTVWRRIIDQQEPEGREGALAALNGMVDFCAASRADISAGRILWPEVGQGFVPGMRRVPRSAAGGGRRDDGRTEDTVLRAASRSALWRRTRIAGAEWLAQ